MYFFCQVLNEKNVCLIYIKINSGDNIMEEIWNKLKSGLQDYCAKNGFKKVILGLSGGLDSAMVAVLAADVLGGENVKAVMMKTKYTSSLSLQIAQEIAVLNHLDYQEVDIDNLIAAQGSFLTAFFREPPKGLVMENLQARQRGVILMALSNQTNALVLACGNKSEAAMGYCTLYGDTCGGLMPLGNIYKSDLYGLAKWRNEQFRVLPSEVLVRAPTAELSLNQKDEDSLPPYSLLDKILKAYIDEGKTIDEIVAGGDDRDLVEQIISRYQRMAFKRQQMAESLAI